MQKNNKKDCAHSADIDLERRKSFSKFIGMGALGVGALGIGSSVQASYQTKQGSGYIQLNSEYADKEKMMLPKSQMKLQKDSVGLVVVNPQIDFLSPNGLGWGIYGASIKENNTIENIGMMFRVAKALKMPVFVSYVVWNRQDFKTLPHTPMNNFIRGTKFAYGMGEGLHANDITSGGGADFLAEYKPFILDNKTVLTTPRKDFGLKGSDLSAQLRKSGVQQVILCGMDANTHLDSHLRDLLADGFEVGVVRDATAGAKLPEGDGYLAGLINFRFMAHELFFTPDIVQKLQNL